MESEPIIEALFDRFRIELASDYERYRNHVYRIFFNCLLQDQRPENRQKYALAAVFHDVGIWTNRTIDYLNPSVRQAQDYLMQTNMAEWAEEIGCMIYWHHKLSIYQGPFAQTVEIFRRADWIDVSLGLLSFGVDNKAIKPIRKRFPNRGFHWFLIKATSKNLLKNPLNPLPMFTKVYKY